MKMELYPCVILVTFLGELGVSFFILALNWRQHIPQKH
jgi:hypothetical protein